MVHISWWPAQASVAGTPEPSGTSEAHLQAFSHCSFMETTHTTTHSEFLLCDFAALSRSPSANVVDYTRALPRHLVGAHGSPRGAHGQPLLRLRRRSARAPFYFVLLFSHGVVSFSFRLEMSLGGASTFALIHYHTRSPAFRRAFHHCPSVVTMWTGACEQCH